jgi:cytochrome b6-f complex iron-sulfur subunit
MDAGQVLLIAIPVVVIAAAVLVIATSRRRDATFSSEARRRDRSATGEVPAESHAELEAVATAEARERADQTKDLVAARSGAPSTRSGKVPVRRDPEEVAVTRRQFFNRGIVGTMALALGGFGTASLGFLWPVSSGGFGGQVKTPISRDDILEELRTKREPYYVPEARTYLVEYPAESIGNAEAAYTGPLATVVEGINETGLVGLYQKCPHLGCRVPWCHSAQWFECPCHGSKYNRVGEKRGGPAPRGMDRWPISLADDGTIEIDTAGIPIPGPAIGINTTGQEREGPDCI